MAEDNSDFIQQFQQEVLSIKHINSEWAEDIAISMLSAFSANVEFSTAKGKIPLNTWIIAIAPSSAGKSLPIREYVYPLLNKVQERSGNLKTDFRLPSTFTPESMTEFLATKHFDGIITRDEVSTLFKETSGRGYTIQLLEFLSTLYDGHIDRRYTISHGDKFVGKCYIVFLGATTPYLYNILDAQTFIQGIGCRILWNVFDTTQRVFTKDDLFSKSMQDPTNNRITKIDEFVEHLSRLVEFTDINIAIDEKSKAAEIITEWANEIEKVAVARDKEKKVLEALYFRKSLVSLLKLCALRRLSRGLPDMKKRNVKDHVELLVEEQDVEWATNKIGYYNDCFVQMLQNWRKVPVERPIETMDNWYGAIEDIMKKDQDRLATRQEIMATIRTNSNKLSEVLGSMVESGKIRKLTGIEVKALSDDVCIRHGIKKSNPNPGFIYKLI